MKKISIFLSICIIASGMGMLLHSASSSGAQVTIKEIEPFLFCSFRHTGPYSDMTMVVPECIHIMQGQNVSPAGPMMSIYYSHPEEGQEASAEWAIAFPISSIAVIQPPLETGQWEFTLVVTAMHTGSYETTGDTLDEMYDWIEANGYEEIGPIIGIYQNAPDANTPPRNLKTELWIPVKKK